MSSLFVVCGSFKYLRSCQFKILRYYLIVWKWSLRFSISAFLILGMSLREDAIISNYNQYVLTRVTQYSYQCRRVHMYTTRWEVHFIVFACDFRFLNLRIIISCSHTHLIIALKRKIYIKIFLSNSTDSYSSKWFLLFSSTNRWHGTSLDRFEQPK